MPTTSPFASSFKSAVKRGTPCYEAVQTIAKRHGKTFNVVCQSLCRAGLMDRQKFNGQWVYWPCEGKKTNATTAKNCQTNMWQHFVDWCIASGCCTPEKMSNNCGSQTNFMTFCRKYFAKQYTGTKTTSTKRKRSTTTGRKRRTSTTTGRKRRTTTGRTKSTSRRRTGSGYKFPATKGRTRRYRRAA